MWRPHGVLSQGEWSELGRLPTADARRDYLAARELGRLLLAEWTGVEPAALRFRQGMNGYPEVVPFAVAPPPPPGFSIAAADGLAIAAVSAHSVGAFVGSFRQVLTEAAEAARDDLPVEELEALRRCPNHIRTERLLVQWTRREAIQRARGRGSRDARPEVVSIRLTPEHVAAVAVVRAPAGWPGITVEEMGS